MPTGSRPARWHQALAVLSHLAHGPPRLPMHLHGRMPHLSRRHFQLLHQGLLWQMRWCGMSGCQLVHRSSDSAKPLECLRSGGLHPGQIHDIALSLVRDMITIGSRSGVYWSSVVLPFDDLRAISPRNSAFAGQHARQRCETVIRDTLRCQLRTQAAVQLASMRSH